MLAQRAFKAPAIMGDASSPFNSHAPKGYYMLLLVTNESVPSTQGVWTKLE
jgi:hypothetical protein